MALRYVIASVLVTFGTLSVAESSSRSLPLNPEIEFKPSMSNAEWLASQSIDAEIRQRFTHPSLPAQLKNFQWKTGQIIGIDQMRFDPASLFISVSTGSAITRVGMVNAEDINDIRILQADRIQEKLISEKIEDFFLRSTDKLGRHNYVVLEPMYELAKSDQVRLLNIFAELKNMNIGYNHDHVYDESNINSLDCSQLIHILFREAGLPAPGEVQTIDTDLNFFGFNRKLLRMYNYANGAGAPSFMETVITPFSVVKSPNFRVVASTVPLSILSDQQIYDRWLEGGGFEAYAASRYQDHPTLSPINALELALMKDRSAKHISVSLALLFRGLEKSGPLNNDPYRELPASFRVDHQPQRWCNNIWDRVRPTAAGEETQTPQR